MKIWSLREPELSTDDSSVDIIPPMITDTTPLSIQEYLDSALLPAIPAYQPHQRTWEHHTLGVTSHTKKIGSYINMFIFSSCAQYPHMSFWDMKQDAKQKKRQKKKLI